MDMKSNREPRRRTARNAGMTLAEAVLALFISSFVALYFLPGVITSSRAVTKASAAEAGIQLAHQKVEELRNSGYNYLPTIPNGQTQVTQSFTPDCELLDPQGTLVVQKLDSSLVPSTTDANRRKVTVTVSWREPGRSTRVSCSSTTLMVKT